MTDPPPQAVPIRVVLADDMVLFREDNITGGAVWAAVMVLIGYLAGASWQHATSWASRIGLALLALILLAVAIRSAARATRRHFDRLYVVGDQLVTTRPALWVRRRFPTQLAWLGRRLHPTGLALTATAVLATLLAFTVGGLAQDVIVADGLAQLDPRVHAFAVAHRTGWLTAILTNATWLGSNWLLLPVLAVATVILLRRRDRWAATGLWAAYLGVIVLYTVVKPLVHRPRPPATELIGHTYGPSFPSGHAAQALGAWGVLALVLLAGSSPRARAAALTAAAVVALLVGASRVYLGAHWLTDVLAGYALAATWLTVLAALRMRQPERTTVRYTPTDQSRPAPTPQTTP